MTMAQAFNEWMRRFIADPQAFESTFQAVEDVKRGPRLNGEPVYGHKMAAYLRKLMREKSPSSVRKAQRKKNPAKARARKKK